MTRRSFCNSHASNTAACVRSYRSRVEHREGVQKGPALPNRIAWVFGENSPKDPKLPRAWFSGSARSFPP